MTQQQPSQAPQQPLFFLTLDYINSSDWWTEEHPLQALTLDAAKAEAVEVIKADPHVMHSLEFVSIYDQDGQEVTHTTNKTGQLPFFQKFGRPALDLEPWQDLTTDEQGRVVLVQEATA